METWTQQQCVWGACSQADVGTQYPIKLKLQSIFNVTLTPKEKQRKVGFTVQSYQCTKIAPEQVFELTQRLNQFLADTWP